MPTTRAQAAKFGLRNVGDHGKNTGSPSKVTKSKKEVKPRLKTKPEVVVEHATTATTSSAKPELVAKKKTALPPPMTTRSRKRVSASPSLTVRPKKAVASPGVNLAKVWTKPTPLANAASQIKHAAIQLPTEKKVGTTRGACVETTPQVFTRPNQALPISRTSNPGSMKNVSPIPTSTAFTKPITLSVAPPSNANSRKADNLGSQLQVPKIETLPSNKIIVEQLIKQISKETTVHQSEILHLNHRLKKCGVKCSRLLEARRIPQEMFQANEVSLSKLLQDSTDHMKMYSSSSHSKESVLHSPMIREAMKAHGISRPVSPNANPFLALLNPPFVSTKRTFEHDDSLHNVKNWEVPGAFNFDCLETASKKPRQELELSNAFGENNTAPSINTLGQSSSQGDLAATLPRVSKSYFQTPDTNAFLPLNTNTQSIPDTNGTTRTLPSPITGTSIAEETTAAKGFVIPVPKARGSIMVSSNSEKSNKAILTPLLGNINDTPLPKVRHSVMDETPSVDTLTTEMYNLTSKPPDSRCDKTFTLSVGSLRSRFEPSEVDLNETYSLQSHPESKMPKSTSSAKYTRNSTLVEDNPLFSVKTTNSATAATYPVPQTTFVDSTGENSHSQIEKQDRQVTSNVRMSEANELGVVVAEFKGLRLEDTSHIEDNYDEQHETTQYELTLLQDYDEKELTHRVHKVIPSWVQNRKEFLCTLYTFSPEFVDDEISAKIVPPATLYCVLFPDAAANE